GPDAAIDQAFEKLLLPGSRSRIDLARRDPALEVGESHRTTQDRGPELVRPARVALLAGRHERPLLDHVRGREQRSRERVDTADMGVEHVGPAQALPAQLRVVVESFLHASYSCQRY